MRERFAWPIGIGIGVVLGYLIGLRQGDIWLGGITAVVWAIAGYGFLAFPQYRTRWSGSQTTYWYTLIGVLTPIVMLVTPNSTLLADELPIVVLLGGTWLGGVNAGIALDRTSTGDINR